MRPLDIIAHGSAFVAMLMFVATLVPDAIIMLLVNAIKKLINPNAKDYNGFSYQLMHHVMTFTLKMLGVELIIDKPVN